MLQRPPVLFKAQRPTLVSPMQTPEIVYRETEARKRSPKGQRFCSWLRGADDSAVVFSVKGEMRNSSVSRGSGLSCSCTSSDGENSFQNLKLMQIM